MPRPKILAIDLGNKKLMRTYCVICNIDMFELKTKEPICEECKKRTSNY